MSPYRAPWRGVCRTSHLNCASDTTESYHLKFMHIHFILSLFGMHVEARKKLFMQVGVVHILRLSSGHAGSGESGQLVGKVYYLETESIS